MVQTDKVVKKYIVMVQTEIPGIDAGGSYWIPLSETLHDKRFSAFMEMEHAKDDPRYAGEVMYIKEVAE